MARKHDPLIEKIIELSKNQIVMTIKDQWFSDDDEPYAIIFRLSKYTNQKAPRNEFRIEYAFTHKELDKLKVGADQVIAHKLTEMQCILEHAANDSNI